MIVEEEPESGFASSTDSVIEPNEQKVSVALHVDEDDLPLRHLARLKIQSGALDSRMDSRMKMSPNNKTKWTRHEIEFLKMLKAINYRG